MATSLARIKFINLILVDKPIHHQHQPQWLWDSFKLFTPNSDSHVTVSQMKTHQTRQRFFGEPFVRRSLSLMFLADRRVT